MKSLLLCLIFVIPVLSVFIKPFQFDENKEKQESLFFQGEYLEEIYGDEYIENYGDEYIETYGDEYIENDYDEIIEIVKNYEEIVEDYEEIIEDYEEIVEDYEEIIESYSHIVEDYENLDDKYKKIIEEVLDYYENMIESEEFQRLDFCTVNGYYVSNDGYTHANAEKFCNIINKKLVSVTDDNFNEIGEILEMCGVSNLKVWIQDIGDTCASYHVDSDSCGTIYLRKLFDDENMSCEEPLSVICY